MFIILNLECIRYEYKYIYIRPPKSKPNFCPTPAESGATPAESGDSIRNQWGTEKYCLVTVGRFANGDQTMSHTISLLSTTIPPHPVVTTTVVDPSQPHRPSTSTTALKAASA